MPKAFLLNGRHKRSADVLCNQSGQVEDSDLRTLSAVHDIWRPQQPDSPPMATFSPPISNHVSDVVSPRGPLSLSESSAFTKICKHPSPDCPPLISDLSATAYAFPNFQPQGIYPGMTAFSNFLQYNWLSGLYSGQRFNFPAGDLAKTENTACKTSEKTSAETGAVGDTNVYYHVDPSVPFTNYFLNLKKLLNKDSIEDTNSRKDGITSNHLTQDKNTDLTSPECGLVDCVDGAKDDSDCESNSSLSSQSDILKTSHNILHQPTVNQESVSPHQRTSPTHGGCGHLQSSPVMFTGGFPSFSSNPYLSHPSTSSNMYLDRIGGRHDLPGIMKLKRPRSQAEGQPTDTDLNKTPAAKKYKCDVCGKAFSRSNTLVTHKRIHTGDKPFSCEICSRAFRQPGNLTRHRLTHTTTKPYVCQICSKAFNRASNLQTHMRTHSNHHPFVCPYCGKGFNQKVDMKIHCYTHTARRGSL